MGLVGIDSLQLDQRDRNTPQETPAGFFLPGIPLLAAESGVCWTYRRSP